jgi:TRAP transporter TAXI family solute receptor
LLGFNRWHLFKMLAVIGSIAIIVWLALAYFIPAPPSKFTIATGAKNQTYEAIGKRYQDILARSHIELDIRLTNGAVENLDLLNDAASGIKVAIVQSGLSDSDHAPDLMSLGRINLQIYWLFHRADAPLNDLRLLKGKRIAIGPVGSGQRATTEKILGASGVSYDNTTLLTLSSQDAETALIDGKIDALFLPFAQDATVLRSLLGNARLLAMNFTEADALTRIIPSLVRLTLPRAVLDFEKIVPAADITLLASPNVVLVRKDIHPALIDLLAQTIVEAHSKPGIYQAAGEFPSQTDSEYPMAQSARDFYKNGPSFLNRYLPFWLTNYAQRALAVLAAVVAIVLPIFSYAPRLCRSLVENRLRSLYRRLRAIEASLQIESGLADQAALEADLDSVDRATNILGVPMRHSEMFFSLKVHIDLVRARLASRRDELLKPASKVA